MNSVCFKGDVFVTRAPISFALLIGWIGLLVVGCSSTSPTTTGFGGGHGVTPTTSPTTWPTLQPFPASYITVTQIADTSATNSPMFWANDPSHPTVWIAATQPMQSQIKLPLLETHLSSAPYQYTYPSSASASCTSAVGVYAYTDHTTNNMAIYLASGTGTTQINADGTFEGASETDIGINAQWTLGTGGFPAGPSEPTYEFPVFVTASTGGFDRVIINLIYTDIHIYTDQYGIAQKASSSTTLSINQKNSPTNPTQYNYVGTVPCNLACYPGDTFTITGTITFKALGSKSSASSTAAQH